MSGLLSLMCKQAFNTIAYLGQGPAVYACPISDGGTAQVETLTFAGTATEDNDCVVRVAGRYLTVGIANGTTAANAAIALQAKFDQLNETLPVTASVTGAVVTATHASRGLDGNDTIYEVIKVPAGLTLTPAVSVAGATALDIQTGLDASAAQDFDAIPVSPHGAAVVTAITTHIATTWSASEKKPRWFFLGEAGTIATATSLATAANHEGVIVCSWEQARSLPQEIATAKAVLMCSKSRPNANYDGNLLPLYPPPIAFDYTSAEVETALNAGLSPLKSVVDNASKTVIEGVGKVVRLITTRTTKNAVPFVLVRDVGISRTAWALTKQYDIAYQAWAEQQPDGPLLDDDSMAQVRDTVVGINYAAQDAKWIRNVDVDQAKTIVERDSTAVGRLNVDNSYTIVVGLHQVAYVHRAQI
jgi:phage tail sheath gpL-like